MGRRARHGTMPAQPMALPGKPGDPIPEKRFQFYDILPGKADAVPDKAGKPEAQKEEPKKEEPKKEERRRRKEGRGQKKEPKQDAALPPGRFFQHGAGC
jgi:hypothetical protein